MNEISQLDSLIVCVCLLGFYSENIVNYKKQIKLLLEHKKKKPILEIYKRMAGLVLNEFSCSDN